MLNAKYNTIMIEIERNILGMKLIFFHQLKDLLALLVKKDFPELMVQMVRVLMRYGKI